MTAARCRECFSETPPDARRCAHCASPRIVRHDELASLSIAHLDCDAFYAAVEKRDDPGLADAPVIIGGEHRGVVTTACYIARAYGVRSAMPMFQAKRACPGAVIIKPNMTKYAAASRRVRALMQEVTPLVEPLSIDEAFLDLTGTRRLHAAPPAATLMALQQRIETDVGITVSVGLSYNKFLAKTASDLDKPRGFSVIGRAEALDFLADKPVSFIYGVGPAFAARLERDGFARIADLRNAADKELAARYGESGLRLARLARAEDERPVSTGGERKSISAETTFNEDISDVQALEDQLWRLCVRVADRAKASATSGRVVTLKLKTADYKIRTRRRSLPAPTQLADIVFRTSRELLAGETGGVRFRLIGVGVSDLSVAAGDQADLIDPDAPKRAAAERASDAARAKFGDKAVVKGRSLRGRHKS